MKRLAYLARIAGVFGGLAIGTASICGMVPNLWGLFSWTLSIISAVCLLATNYRPANFKSNSVILRTALGSVVVFCFVFLTAMSVAVEANLCKELVFEDKVAAVILTIVGTSAFATLIAIR